MTDWAEPPLTMNWTLALHGWPLDEEKVHMLAAHPGVMLANPWPLPQSTSTEVEPGMVTASHQALVPLYQVTASPEEESSSSQGHGHSHWPAATAMKADTTTRSANRAKRMAEMEAMWVVLGVSWARLPFSWGWLMLLQR